MKKLIASLLLLLGVCIWPSKAQAPDDVAPYKFAVSHTSTFSHIDLYKTVYQGCEIFVSEENGYRDNMVSIAVGRGCR